MVQNIAGIILAGGLSSRMGGGDKCLLELSGKPILRHVIERIRPQVAMLGLSANGNPNRFSQIGLPILPDTIEGYVGPLAGVLAGLEWIEKQDSVRALVTVAGDTPFFPRDLVSRLALAADPTEDTIAVARAGERDHPTFALWPKTMASPLRSYLLQGGRRVFGFIEARSSVAVDFQSNDGTDPFFNINTPENLAEAERIVGEGSA